MIQSGDNFNIVHERRLEGSVMSGPYTCSHTKDDFVYYYDDDNNLRFRLQANCYKVEDEKG